MYLCTDRDPLKRVRIQMAKIRFIIPCHHIKQHFFSILVKKTVNKYLYTVVYVCYCAFQSFTKINPFCIKKLFSSKACKFPFNEYLYMVKSKWQFQAYIYILPPSLRFLEKKSVVVECEHTHTISIPSALASEPY